MATKSEKGKQVRQRILDRLHYYGDMGLGTLAKKVGEPRRAVAAHLTMMLAGGEVARRPVGPVAMQTELWYPLKWRTKVSIHGGAVRKVRRTVNICGSQAPIKGQCADHRGVAPRQSTQGKAFGLL